MEQEQKKQNTRLRADMPFLAHLEELRGVLIHSAIAVAVLGIASWFVSEPVLRFITDPGGELVFLGPTEAFTLRIKVALLCGLFGGLPYILYKLWGFIAPGLMLNERKMIAIVVGGSTILFFAGSAFSFFIIMPIALRFLLGFQTAFLTPMISASNYFGFVTRLCLALGIVFQLPLVVSLLTWVGILEPRWLLSNWRYALVSIALVSALFTPPDIASQFLMAVPVVGLYFFSAFLSMLIARRKKEIDGKDAEEGENRSDGEAGGVPDDPESDVRE